MVGIFKRSLSFPNKINPGSQSLPSKPPISHHTRSISLPCGTHPLITHIVHDISQLKSWFSSFSSTDGEEISVRRRHTSAGISQGLSLLKDVHESLADALHLPQSQDFLRNRPIFIENLLEDFLRFVDAYGIFRTSVLALSEHQSAAQVALRKRDDEKITSYLKSRQNLARDIAKLASSIRDPKTKQEYCHFSTGNSNGDREVASIIGDVIEATVSVSVALFDGVHVSLRGRTKTTPFVRFLKRTSEKKERTEEGIEELKRVDEKVLSGLRKKKDEEVNNLMKIMAELENSISEIESGSERVFRSLIKTRVSLLNALTN